MSDEVVQLNHDINRLTKAINILCDISENLRSCIEDLSENLLDVLDPVVEENELIDEEVIEKRAKRLQ